MVLTKKRSFGQEKVGKHDDLMAVGLSSGYDDLFNFEISFCHSQDRYR